MQYIIIDDDRDIEMTAEVFIEHNTSHLGYEETIRPYYSIASNDYERLVWYYNRLHLLTPSQYTVKVASTRLNTDQTLVDNTTAMKQWLTQRKALFWLGAATVYIDSTTKSIIISANPGALLQYKENGKVIYDEFVGGSHEATR